MKKHILVIDDDNKLRNLIIKHLKNEGFYVNGAENPQQADVLLNIFDFDALIMDVMMPKKDGFTYLKELKEKAFTTPIIMLTAMGNPQSRIQGLEYGADDYLPKPFEPKELTLRINNIIKRYPQPINYIPLFDNILFFPKKGILQRNNDILTLTSIEKELFYLLSKNLYVCVSREKICSTLEIENPRTVDVQITRLRKKIENIFHNKDLIQTNRGKGYTLVGK